MINGSNLTIFGWVRLGSVTAELTHGKYSFSVRLETVGAVCKAWYRASMIVNFDAQGRLTDETAHDLIRKLVVLADLTCKVSAPVADSV